MLPFRTPVIFTAEISHNRIPMLFFLNGKRNMYPNAFCVYHLLPYPMFITAEFPYNGIPNERIELAICVK